jgi:hypothetical protein
MVLKGKTQYEHKSERPVHLSMAALDTTSTRKILFFKKVKILIINSL